MRTLSAFAALALTLSLAARSDADELQHFTKIEEGVAAAEGRDVLVDFTGSDWCHWCVKLHEEVFSQEAFVAAAKDKYVFVELDFPRQKPQPEEQKAYNQKQAQTYGVQGYPTIVLLDAAGLPYARTGYQPGGAEGYLKHLAQLGERKAEIKKLRAAAGEGEPAARLEATVALLEKLEEWEVDFAYLDLKVQAADLDADNAAGKRQEYARDLALAYHQRKDAAQAAKYLEVLKGLDPAAAAEVETLIEVDGSVLPLLNAQDWGGALEKLKAMADRAGAAGQHVHFLMAICEIRRGNRDACVALLKKALELAPDGPRAENIKQALQQLGG